jgi:hypothetical protein
MSSTRVISQSISPTSTDVKTLRGPFAAKGANDPVILELRNALKKCTPDWLTKLDEKADLTIDRLTQIKESVGFRRSIIESLPAGAGRYKALAELDQAEVTIDEMLSELNGVGPFGAGA